MFAAILADETAGLVLADLSPADQAALASVPASSLLAFAAAISSAHHQRAALIVRDCCLIALAEDFDFSAAQIAREMVRYAGSGWKRDLAAAACPVAYVGRPAAMLWLAFKASPQPLSKRRIEQVIETACVTAKLEPPSDFRRARP
ncbi:hypothetical protein X731_16310 [Mesorhizobium sp. L2C054A000]|nr:hypothetical protein [Mesorhizobium sp. L2C054A000]ESZ46247.1 hypothetical protein X731_16310 [Mesorhizobium sp. L2C054A000]